MAKVEIYTWQYCPYCLRAKALLKSKGVDFIEHAIDGDSSARMEMSSRAKGRSTLPQIFINEQAIGGCDDLHALEKDHKLDDLLGLMN